MLKLMNSAMMPVPGTYTARKITPEQAKEIIDRHNGIFESFIGYKDTAEHMSKVLGVNVPINRIESSLADGDEILVCKLKYRVKDPSNKGSFTPGDGDYEWWYIQYKGAE